MQKVLHKPMELTTQKLLLVAKLNTIRVRLSIAMNLDWPLHQLDIKNAFMNGELAYEIYMDAPPAFAERFGSKVCKLKNLYMDLNNLPGLGLNGLQHV